MRDPTRGEVSSAMNPTRLCDASQNGFVCEWPQRHSATADPSGSSNSRPSASTILIGPTTLYGPFARTVMLTWLTIRPVAPTAAPRRLQSRPVPLRICLVTPHAWTVPHDTNEHVAGVANALRARSHDVVVLAPSSRSRDLLAGRRALQAGELEGVVAVSRAVPVSPRSAVGIPVGVRANVATALRRGGFDVVHGFDPGLPGLAYVALLEAETTTAATFVDPERLSYPPRRNLRDRLLARVDHLVATSENVAKRAAERFPGSYTVVPPGVDLERFSLVRRPTSS